MRSHTALSFTLLAIFSPTQSFASPSHSHLKDEQTKQSNIIATSVKERRDVENGASISSQKYGEEQEETDNVGKVQLLNMLAEGHTGVPYAAMAKGLQHIEQMTAGPLKLAFTSMHPSSVECGYSQEPGLAHWNSIGPHDVLSKQLWALGHGPMNGRVISSAFDPKIKGHYWIDADGGGVWTTYDRGVTWKVESDKWPLSSTACIDVNPQNGADVFVGTDGYGAGVASGIMETYNSGKTWEMAGNSIFGFDTVSTILFDPDNPQIMLAAYGGPKPGGIARSVDGGRTWTQCLKAPGMYVSLVVSLPNAQGVRTYYTASDYHSTIYASTDAGLTWKPLPTKFGTGVLRVAASAVKPDTLYCEDPQKKDIVESDDAGKTWHSIKGDLKSVDGSYFICHEDPITHEDDLMDGEVDTWLYRGTKDKKGLPKWKAMFGVETGPELTHCDQHGISFDPTNPMHMLVTNDGGVYSAYINGKTYNVKSLNSDLDINMAYDAEIVPSDPTKMIAGSQDEGTLSNMVIGTGKLNQNTWMQIVDADGFQCAIDPQDPGVQYGTIYDESIQTTTDYWKTRKGISPKIPKGENKGFYTPLARDLVTGDVYTASNFLYRYDPKTGKWKDHVGGQSFAGPHGSVRAIQIAPSDHNVVYTGSTDGKIFMTTDAGAHWKEIDNGKFSALVSIAIDPDNPYAIYASGSGPKGSHFWYCANTQSPNWWNITGVGAHALPDLFGYCIACSPVDPLNDLFAGTMYGLFYTKDGGQNWYPMSKTSNLPNVWIYHITITPGAGKYVGDTFMTLATYGRGMWQTNLTPPTPSPSY